MSVKRGKRKEEKKAALLWAAFFIRIVDRRSRRRDVGGRAGF
jgi:hypothetical protein